MKKLRNTLYVLEDGYLHSENNHLLIDKKGETIASVPLINLSSICVFGYSSVSVPLIGICYQNGIALSFFSRNGKFQGRIEGKPVSSVFTRLRQNDLLSDSTERMRLTRTTLIAKIYNARSVLKRYIRQYPLRIDVEKVKRNKEGLDQILKELPECDSFERMRGLEGLAARDYFDCWDELILNQKEFFSFSGRNKRPPLDGVNALLSLTYTMLTNDVAAACDAAGLDPYVGINHVLRPGRKSMALDLVEELRPVIADRFVLSLINKKVICEEDFNIKENGAYLLNEKGKKKFFQQWYKNKQTELVHPFLNETVTWGLVPFIQAQLFADYIRGELDDYPCFFWK